MNTPLLPRPLIALVHFALMAGCASAPHRAAQTPAQTPPPNESAPMPASANVPPASTSSEPPVELLPPIPASSTAYPARFEPLAPADVAARERVFRARNPEPWTTVTFDAYGMLESAQIVGPMPTAMPTAPEYDDAQMATRWSAFLTRNRDVLGLDAAGMQPAPANRRAVGQVQQWGNYFIGEAQVSWNGVGYSDRTWTPAGISVGGHGWPIRVPAVREQTDDELVARYVRMRGTLHTNFTAHTQPCDPVGPGDCAGQRSPVAPPPAHRPYVLARDELRVTRGICHYHPPSDPGVEIRIVASIEIHPHLAQSSQPAVGPGMTGNSNFEPGANQPHIPTRTDAVTGQDLSAGRCDEYR